MYNLEIKNNEAVRLLKIIPKDNYTPNANGFIIWLESTKNDLNYKSIELYSIYNYRKQIY